MKIIVNENQFKRLILKEQLNDEGGEDHFLRHKTVVDYDAKPLIEWNECSSDVKNHNGPVLLMFSNPACGPCKKIKKIMDMSEEFNSWVYDNNIELVNIGCTVPDYMRNDPGKCRSRKCSNGKSMSEDYVDMMEKFGGDPHSTGLKIPGMSHGWTGVPSFFITDSSFNKKSKRIGLKGFEIKDLIEVLEKEI